MDEIARRLSEAMTDEDGATPWLFFGHSFGGVIAYAVGCLLNRNERSRLKGMIVSACPAPHRPPKRSFMLHELPREELFRELHKLDGIPARALEDRKLQALIEPALRADIRCRELWSVDMRRRGAPVDPLHVPIYPMGGAADEFVSEEDLAEWRRYTTGGRSVALFRGGHFYFRLDPGAVMARITRIAEELCGVQ